MDDLARQDIAAAAGAHTELGQPYDAAVAEGLVERISSEIDKQVDARLAQRGIQPSLQLSRSAWANLAMGLGSVGLGIGATAVILQSWPASAVSPKAVLDLGSFHASLMTNTRSVSTSQIILIALIWAAIAVINVAYARRHPGRT
jgi:hypothetical protein